MKPSLKIERRSDDKEFKLKRAWPSNSFFEDDPEAAKPELCLTYLSRHHSFSDTSSLMGNSSSLCLQSILAGIGA